MQEAGQISSCRLEQGEGMKAHCLISLLVLLAIVAGCVSPPDQKKDAVQAKLDSLQGTNVDRYLSELCAEARDSFSAAIDEIAKQSDVSFFSRSYEQAEKQLAYADSVLIVAVDSVSALDEESAAIIDSLRVRATAILDSATTLVVSLEESSADDPEYMALRRRLVDFSLQMGGANRAYNDWDFVKAGVLYDVVIQGVEGIRQDLRALR